MMQAGFTLRFNPACARVFFEWGLNRRFLKLHIVCRLFGVHWLFSKRGGLCIHVPERVTVRFATFTTIYESRLTYLIHHPQASGN
jgi:hypothetical protein